MSNTFYYTRIYTFLWKFSNKLADISTTQWFAIASIPKSLGANMWDKFNTMWFDYQWQIALPRPPANSVTIVRHCCFYIGLVTFDWVAINTFTNNKII